MPDRNLDDMWKRYRRDVLSTASTRQVAEHKVAFYGGCAGLLDLILGNSQNKAEAAVIALLENLKNEIEVFAASSSFKKMRTDA